MPQTLSEANGGSEYHVAFAALVRNEARWLPEWLAYHALPSIGVGHFYLYDDGSSDELRTAIAPHVARGLVTLHSRFDVAMGLDGERRSANMVVAGDSSEAGSEHPFAPIEDVEVAGDKERGEGRQDGHRRGGARAPKKGSAQIGVSARAQPAVDAAHGYAEQRRDYQQERIVERAKRRLEEQQQ